MTVCPTVKTITHTYMVATMRTRRRLGQVLLSIWSLGLVALVYWLIYNGFGPDAIRWWVVAYMLLLGPWAGRFFAKTADEVLAADSRAPILFLRSDADDNTLFTGNLLVRYVLPLLAADLRDFQHPTLENYLERTSRKFGPVVALGRPRDYLPPIGAARRYVEDAVWQVEITRLMDAAGAVLLVAGHTPGLLWEVQQLAQRSLLAKLIIVFPPLPPTELNSRWLRIRNALEEAGITGLPEAFEEKTLLGVFDSLAQFRFVTYQSRKWLDWELTPRTNYSDEMYYELLLEQIFVEKGLQTQQAARMSRRGCLIWITVLSVVSAFQIFGPILYQPRAVVVGPSVHKASQADRRQIASHIWILKNEGWAPLRLSISTRLNCRIAGVPIDGSLTVDPGKQAEIVMTWQPTEKPDAAIHSVLLRTNDPSLSTVELRAEEETLTYY